MVCLRGRGMTGNRRSMSSNGVNPTASMPSVNGRLKPRETPPIELKGQPVGGDGWSREVMGEVLEAVAVIGGDAHVGVALNASTDAHRRPMVVVPSEAPDPRRSVRAQGRGPDAATPAT